MSATDPIPWADLLDDNKTVRVTLNRVDLEEAARVGAARHAEALCSGRKDKHGYKGNDGWNIHIEGACGELVVAKLLQTPWNKSVNTFKAPDVLNYQVRTRLTDHYGLLVRPHDPDNSIFILVVGKAPVFEVRGWLQGCDAKQPRWLHAHGGRAPAYFVPSTDLHSIFDLPQ